MIPAGGGVVLRPMRDVDADYALVAAWRGRPHVHHWWDPDLPAPSAADVRGELQPYLRSGGPDLAAIIEVDGVPVGFVQYYPWAAYLDDLRAMSLSLPEGAWGLDILIGEPAHLSRGVGSRAVRAVCDHVLRTLGATAVAFGVDRDNLHAHRAYLRAGMTPGGEYLDLDTRDGQRIRCVLMLRSA